MRGATKAPDEAVKDVERHGRMAAKKRTFIVVVLYTTTDKICAIKGYQGLVLEEINESGVGMGWRSGGSALHFFSTCYRYYELVLVVVEYELAPRRVY